MKLTHIQVFKKRLHETMIKCFCLRADTLFLLLMFCMFRYITKYTNKYLNMDIVVYLKNDVKFTLKKYTCYSIKLLN